MMKEYWDFKKEFTLELAQCNEHTHPLIAFAYLSGRFSYFTSKKDLKS